MPEASVALCGIVRNEIRSIVEWLAHYKALGVTEFLIYDNDSTDGTTELLRALDEADEIIHLDWPHAVGPWPQRQAYEHARKWATADWLAYFDADEFLFLREDASIGQFLARFDEDVAAVAVNWVIFGSGGQAFYRPLPVTERFTDALPASASWSRVVKSIGRRSLLTGTGVHRLGPGTGRYVQPSGQEMVFDGPMRSPAVDTGVAALHHYMVKSHEEFQEKLDRGNANSKYPAGRRKRLGQRFSMLDAGGVENRDMLAFAARMRVEALRLRDILLSAGLNPPVWPFVEATDGG
jgi:glycosyltransferase involved in cell wall biosynthesis